MQSFLYQIITITAISCLLFNFLWFLGNLLFGSFLKPTGHYVAIPAKMFLAFVFISCLIGCIKTGGLSIVTPALLVLIFIVIKTFNRDIFKTSNLNIKDCLTVNSFFLLVILSQLLLHIPFNSSGIYANNRDLGFYSLWSNVINRSSFECWLDSRLFNTSHATLYHYAELWFNGYIANLFSINSYFFFILFFKSFMLFTGTCLMYGLVSAFVQSKFIRFFSVFFTLIGPLPFLFYMPASVWQLSFDHNAGFYSIIGGYMGINWFLMCFVLLLSMEFSFIPFLLLSIGGCINPLFIGVVPMFFGIKAIYAWKFEKKTVPELSHLLYGLLISTVIIGFGFLHYGNPGRTTSPVHGIKLIADIIFIFVRTALIAIIECGIGVFGIYYLVKQKQISSGFLSTLLIFTLSGYLFMSIIFPTMPGDIYELSFNINVIAFYFFGFAGFLYAVGNNYKPWKSVLLVVFVSYCAIGSLYMVKFTLGILPAGTNLRTCKFYSYKMLDGFTNLSKAKGNGASTEITTQHRYMNLAELSTLTEITQTRPIIRLNVTLKDTNKLGDPTYFQTFSHSKLYPVYLDYKQNKSAYYRAAIDSLKINWVLVNNKEMYPDTALLKYFPNVVLLDSFRIYSRN